MLFLVRTYFVLVSILFGEDPAYNVRWFSVAERKQSLESNRPGLYSFLSVKANLSYNNLNKYVI